MLVVKQAPFSSGLVILKRSRNTEDLFRNHFTSFSLSMYFSSTLSWRISLSVSFLSSGSGI
nr:MAG TPA: hypothetical protein [Caudoviricetes sp.]